MIELLVGSRKDGMKASGLHSSVDSLVGTPGLVAHMLQYEVREGREAGEAVIVPQAFIANRNSSFILLEVPGE